MIQMLDCIGCPVSCRISVELDGEKNIKEIAGNTCKRGYEYARNEILHPVRMVTSTVAVSGGDQKRLPVVTSAPVPKDRVFDVMEEIHGIHVCAPVVIDAIIRKNICGLDVDLLASASMDQQK